MYTRRSEDIQGNRLFIKHRSSHQRYFITKGVLRNFAKIHRKTHVPKSPFLYPRRQPEGFYEMGSVRTSVLPFFRPSFRLARRLLGIVSLFLSKFWHGARNPFEVMHVRVGFSRKMFFCPQNYENGPKTGFFKFNVWNNNNYFGLIQVFY